MGSSQNGPHAAFFYGTLMAPEVFFTVCYRFSTDNVAVLKSLHQFQPAMLHGYCRRRVKFADYPGITPDPDHEVRDKFEGSEYERKTVRARLLSKVGDDKGNGNVEGEEVECEVYVFKNQGELEDREWDFEEFRTQKMKKWMREDYGFADSEHFSSQRVETDKEAAAICK
ncbi:hypothetical protein NUW58_g2215 [Xylaria curta]|uniref:Uncharacterized protein n=1 Tax=Xylaria curta TaxID=42375 RepID=A0ACC1PGL3_9PEZI|nr:hypothetical protein NUW58_g2215 [Xylaria curta]